MYRLQGYKFTGLQSYRVTRLQVQILQILQITTTDKQSKDFVLKT